MTVDRLTSVGKVDRRGLAAVTALLDSHQIRSAWYAASTGSTNTHALEELHDQSAAPLIRLILADRQLRGRGRHGRAWISSQQTLTFSLIVPLRAGEPGFSLLSLSVGVGIATAIEEIDANVRPRLKWPNDVYCQGCKLAGVLLETTASRPDRLVIGIGVNVGTAPQLSDLESSAPAIGLQSLMARQLHRYDLLEPIVRHVCAALGRATLAPQETLAQFRARCLLSGQEISYSRGQQHFRGLCLGIADDAALIVKVDGVTQTLGSGEVSVVRRAD